MATTPETFDFVIIGGGTAGLVLATRISEHQSLGRVLVLEAGDDQTDDMRVNLPPMWTTLIPTASNWALETVPQAGLFNRKGSLASGRLLGGSSGLNGLSFAPPSKSVVDAWVGLGNPGWEWERFFQSFSKSFSLPNSGKGPLKLSFPDDDEEWKWPSTWRETLRTLGYPVDVDIYGLAGEHCGATLVADSINPFTKQRSYVANDYYGQAKTRANLTVKTGAEVQKILFDEAKDNDGNYRATGVLYNDKDGQTHTVTATKELIITAGTPHSPRLLEVSGIGNKSLLQSRGMTNVIVDNPSVGENLQNHVLCSQSYELAPTQEKGFDTMDSLARQDPAAMGAAMEAYTQRQNGPFSRSGANATALLPLPGMQNGHLEPVLDTLLSQTGSASTDDVKQSFARRHESFVRSLLDSPAGPSGHYLTFAGFAVVTDDGSMAPSPPGDAKYFTIMVSLAHPLSRGSIHVSSDSVKSPPTVNPNYLSNPLDLEVLARHFQFVASTLTKAEPLTSRITRKLGNTSVSADELEEMEKAKDFLTKHATGAAHYVGTCSMMPRELGGVVDPKLRVYGCANLRVCDASIVPIIPSSNIQATVYGVAEHGAEIIIADYL
ncbi:hypothetical protein N0V93_005496 [Gnomoniopsis smithogilvyi]|uniref:Glucose-methanol-choline oxidoreductase N-terminal domain-containing protein n=1 Tax=Gnomoniopsis smithogilvyi TaxID=1191159 RepID=A0A9W8YUK8_9PEZI|nr:hypothetical protein N0V93_005496 [Gnomoniopsis smithogilvyi]